MVSSMLHKLLLLLAAVLLLLLLPAARAATVSRTKRFVPTKVCYTGLGCFSTGGNFYNLLIRPIQLVPQSPAVIKAKYQLYTRDNVVKGQPILYNKPGSVSGSKFKASRPTKVVVHGFLEDFSAQWMHDMKKALLLHGDYNVLLMDWSGGNQLPYTQATANTRVAGALLAQLLQWLGDDFGVKPSSVHVLGHSLGAHIAGYAGERLKGAMGRITGMDAAGPYFEGTHPEVRLDPTDAKFVDAIHTDGDSLLNTIKLDGGFGLMQPVGHVDFYPNGGKKQPNCRQNPIINIIIDGIIEGTKWTVACHHLRVLPLMTNMILNKRGDYKAMPCSSYDEFKRGRCSSCGPSGCATMGMAADQWKPNGRKNVKMFLDTSGDKPFETHQYVVKVTISGVSSAKKQYGDLQLTLESSGGSKTSQLSVVEKSYMQPGELIGAVVTNDKAVFDINSVRIDWRHRWWMSVGRQHLHVNRVEVFEMFTEKSSLYCAHNTSIVSGKSLTLKKSSSC